MSDFYGEFWKILEPAGLPKELSLLDALRALVRENVRLRAAIQQALALNRPISADARAILMKALK